MTVADRLFVYGTLHPDRAPAEIRGVVRCMKRIGEGTVMGTLHNLGDFPGLVLDGKQKIHGVLFELPDDPEALKKLDEYEEYVPSDPANSLFVRTKRTVTMAGGKKSQPWVYVYNRPLQIPCAVHSTLFLHCCCARFPLPPAPMMRRSARR